MFQIVCRILVLCLLKIFIYRYTFCFRRDEPALESGPAYLPPRKLYFDFEDLDSVSKTELSELIWQEMVDFHLEKARDSVAPSELDEAEQTQRAVRAMHVCFIHRLSFSFLTPGLLLVFFFFFFLYIYIYIFFF